MPEPNQAPPRFPNREAFVAWAEQQPRGRWELLDGHAVEMSAERVGHVRAKQAATNALAEAIRKAGAPCEALGDGAAVAIGERSAYEPDALGTCGARLDDDLVFVPNPVIVIEVTSPSNSRIDAGVKLLG